MKKQLVIFLFICSGFITGVFAQDMDSPGSYMTAINDVHLEMNQKYLAYMSAAAHGRRARKVEKLRKQVLESIESSRYNTINLPIYKGDNSLRQSSIDYIKLCYNVFNEDYARIVNMEEIAEQSYDEMQAYLLLREQTSKKINEALNKMDLAARAFADKYNVEIVNTKDAFDQKLEDAGNLNRYTDKIFLIFFKCYWQDGEIVKAMNAGKLIDIEQGRNSLIRFADEGLAGLDTLMAFAGDPSLSNSCRSVLKFYKKMAQEDLPKQSDYFLKKENFEKVKRAFDSKPERDRTKKDVDEFNKAVSEVNAASESFNRVNKTTNENRNKLLKDWNDAEKAFQDNHMPHYK